MFAQINQRKKTYLYIALQLFIVAAALFGWLLTRGSLFHKTFTLDEYLVSAQTVVVEDVTTDDTMSSGGVFLTTPELSLQKGSYLIYIHYNANAGESTVHGSSSQLGFMEMTCPDALLNPAYHRAEMMLDLSRSVTDFTLSASFSGSGYLSITGISITETTDQAKRAIVRAFALCLLLNLLLLFRKSSPSSRKVMLTLAAIFGVSCYPLYLDYLPVGHDINFHLLRIEGIAKGLSNHTFPVKIHPFWAKDYGYAVGVMYGDAFLYFPALLRRFGYSVQSAYKLYAASINLGTVVISYFTFKRMFQRKQAGLLGSLVYSLSVYRLIDTYTRASAGEYTAMMFFPVVLCGFYLIFTEASRENWHKYAAITSLGLTGLIQSHILSCEMAAFVILAVCLLLIRRVFRRYTFTALAFAALLSVLLNLGFLVPFLDYYGTDLYINSESWTGSTIGFFQDNGLFPVQLFPLFGHGSGSAYHAQAGVSHEVTITMGIAFLLGLLLFLYLVLCHYKECRARKHFAPACVCTALGCLLLYMSTCYFPWEAIASWGAPVKKLIYSMEFPWRLLAPATVLLTFSCCFSVSVLYDIYAKPAVHMILLSLSVLSAINCGWYLYDFTFSGDPYRVYTDYEQNSMCMFSYDYLPAETDPENIEDNLIVTEGISSFEAYEKQGTKILCSVAAEKTGGYIDFPLNYYKYYACRDTVTGEPLEVSGGYNHMVRVSFPANYSGEIFLSFREPLHWRLSELLSLLTVLGLGCFPLYRKYRAKRPAKGR